MLAVAKTIEVLSNETGVETEAETGVEIEAEIEAGIEGWNADAGMLLDYL